MKSSDPTYYAYVDESIHQAAGFIVMAAVFSATDLQAPLTTALITCGLQPLIEEYKSSSLKKNSPRDIRLRSEFHQILFQHHCKIGFAVTDVNERAPRSVHDRTDL